MTCPNAPDRGISTRSEGTTSTAIGTLGAGLAPCRVQAPPRGPLVPGVILPQIPRASDANMAEAAVSATKQTERPPPKNLSITTATARGPP
jgi:hypothetical protein